VTFAQDSAARPLPESPIPHHPAASIRLAIIDDDALVRAGFKALLTASADLQVVGEGESGLDVARIVRDLRPDVVLIDVRMPGMNGIDAVRAARGFAHGTPAFLMMTAFDEDGTVLEAILAGADGFLLKDEGPEEIVRAIRHVARGEASFSPRSARQLRDWVARSPSLAAQRRAEDLLAQLTVRERDVAVAIASGASDRDIGALLFVAESTVKSSLRAINLKWGTENRVQVAVVVAQSGVGL
jgi:DNA-binding NarL/FixJ family response regulator